MHIYIYISIYIHIYTYTYGATVALVNPRSQDGVNPIPFFVFPRYVFRGRSSSSRLPPPRPCPRDRPVTTPHSWISWRLCLSEPPYTMFMLYPTPTV